MSLFWRKRRDCNPVKYLIPVKRALSIYTLANGFNRRQLICQTYLHYTARTSTKFRESYFLSNEHTIGATGIALEKPASNSNPQQHSNHRFAKRPTHSLHTPNQITSLLKTKTQSPADQNKPKTPKTKPQSLKKLNHLILKTKTTSTPTIHPQPYTLAPNLTPSHKQTKNTQNQNLKPHKTNPSPSKQIILIYPHKSTPLHHLTQANQPPTQTNQKYKPPPNHTHSPHNSKHHYPKTNSPSPPINHPTPPAPTQPTNKTHFTLTLNKHTSPSLQT